MSTMGFLNVQVSEKEATVILSRRFEEIFHQKNKQRTTWHFAFVALMDRQAN